MTQLTDNEIIKALECCSKGEVYADCERLGCPLYLGISLGCKYVDNENKLYADALDLINRQQAEIEKLKIENQALRMAANSYKLHYNEAKVEAVKEFADRLKKECIIDRGYEILQEGTIDDLVKEMAGDTE